MQTVCSENFEERLELNKVIAVEKENNSVEKQRNRRNAGSHRAGTGDFVGADFDCRSSGRTFLSYA